MQVINGICVLVIIGMFALTVDGKHMQQEANSKPQRDVVAEYAQPVSNGLTTEENRMLVALASHMGKHK